jgi:sulfatase maturation enzyme AslB (radical SAM superfamily)
MHPDIEEILHTPERIDECGFVLNTNGTLRPELDHLLIVNQWLTAISLHGRKTAHENYSRSRSFDVVTRRIESLAKDAAVHIYTVLHDGLTAKDIRWLFQFRDQVGAKFLRFIAPRNFGRVQPLTNEGLIQEVVMRLDNASGFKTSASNTRFITVCGQMRFTN